MPWNERVTPCAARKSRTSRIVAPGVAEAERLSGRVRVLVRLKASVVAPAKARRHVRERRHAALDCAPLRIGGALAGHARMVLRDHAEQRRGEPARRRVGAHLPHVHGEDRAARSLDPLDHLALHRKRAHEPVEVSDHDHVHLARLDKLHRLSQPVAAFERRSARDVRLLKSLGEFEPVALTREGDTLALFSGDANRSPSRSPTRETRTMPTARREETGVVEEGKPAPDFELTSDEGETVHLVLACAGQPVVRLLLSPATTRPVALPRPAVSGTTTRPSASAAQSCSGSARTTRART